jgi:hypothetical protein
VDKFDTRLLRSSGGRLRGCSLESAPGIVRGRRNENALISAELREEGFEVGVEEGMRLLLLEVRCSLVYSDETFSVAARERDGFEVGGAELGLAAEDGDDEDCCCRDDGVRWRDEVCDDFAGDDDEERWLDGRGRPPRGAAAFVSGLLLGAGSSAPAAVAETGSGSGLGSEYLASWYLASVVFRGVFLLTPKKAFIGDEGRGRERGKKKEGKR